VNPRHPFLPVLLAAAALAACRHEQDADATTIAALAPGPLRVALAAHAGDTALDEQIRATQAKVRERADVPRLERLATLFIGKARRSGDPGFYKQAEACAEAMPKADGGAHAALLVRGHVRHALHDFAGAERIARELVGARGMHLDHGLLGDVLLDRGELAEARTVYQRMLDLKPGLQSYARAAQLRWLGGDVAGCRELLGLAAAAGSQRDPESLAWVLARRAVLELHAGEVAAAHAFADQALALVPGYPAALLARGRAAAAADRHADAADDLAAAAKAYPLPESLWAAADSLRAAGRAADAAAAEAELAATGEREDPRTFSLWLSTREHDAAAALRAADAEFAVRQDAYTLDALAIARLRNGDVAGAGDAIGRALAVGVRDARVFVHATLIAEAVGDRAAATQHAQAAAAGASALLPSERQLLAACRARL
jgi:tetratricopeptide (TPR) repeat protein